MSLSPSIIAAVAEARGGALGIELWGSGRDIGEILTTTLTEPVHSHFSAIGATLLQLASFAPRRPGCAQLLLGAGAELDVHSAAGLGMVAELNALLEADPSSRERRLDTFTPLQYAIASNQGESVSCLLGHGADPNAAVDKIAWFIWEEAAVERQMLGRWMAIHMAALYGASEAAEALVDGGANLSAKCLFGTEVMHLAGMADGFDMLSALAALGADPNGLADAYPEEANSLMHNASDYTQIVGVSGRTPLMVAAAEGHFEASRRLLELGADREVVDSAGRTALDYANKGFYGKNGKIARLIETR